MKHTLFPLFFFLCALMPLSDIRAHTHVSTAERLLQNRVPSTDRRYPTLIKVLRLLEERNAKVLVETGTARAGTQGFEMDGSSTVIFGDWAYQHHSTLYSVDINPLAVKNAKRVTRHHHEH